jgi:hypothetical protein
MGSSFGKTSLSSGRDTFIHVRLECHRAAGNFLELGARGLVKAVINAQCPTKRNENKNGRFAEAHRP